MKLIPTKYLLVEGATAPDDTVVKECPNCKRKFAVPKDELEDDDMYCEDCESEYQKMLSENPDNTEAKDTIKAALGI